MKDYDAIRNLIARYSHAAEVIDPDAYAAVFTENGSMTEYGETVTTRDRLRAMMAHGQSIRAKRGEFTEFYRHLQMNSLIEVDGDTGTTITDFLLLVFDGEGWRVRGTGRYRDEVVKEADGQWLFKSRVVEFSGGVTLDGQDPEHEGRMAAIFRSARESRSGDDRRNGGCGIE